MVGAITGHCGLKRHLRKIRLSTTFECNSGLEEETDIHVVICDYPEFSQLRHWFLGQYIVTPSEVLKSGPAVLDRLKVETGRIA